MNFHTLLALYENTRRRFPVDYEVSLSKLSPVHDSVVVGLRVLALVDLDLDVARGAIVQVQPDGIGACFGEGQGRQG